MKTLILHPLFVAGLLIRVALIEGTSPTLVIHQYAPFLEFSIRTFALDPWSAWLDAGGSLAAFPYGYVMWLAFMPLSLVTKAVGWPLQYAYAATVVVADIAMLLVLNQITPRRQRLVLAVYWLSPIVILASYVLGYNDLVPALLLMVSFLFVRRFRLAAAGGSLAAAISANLSMVIALPFFAIYFYRKRALRQRARELVLGFVIGSLVLGIPFALSSGAVSMLFNNLELDKVYYLALDLGGGFSIYLMPLIYILLLYKTWRIGNMNFDMFQVAMGMAFLLVVIMTPVAPGWFIWCVPFLYLYLVISDGIALLLIAIYLGMYFLSTLLATPVRLANGMEINLSSSLQIPEQLDTWSATLLHTVMVATGIIVALRIWREAVGGSDYFRLSRKPFVIGIAGDSGAGKDTLAEAIAGLFGAHSVIQLSGDDYHLWDRQKPMWQVMTHLNPMANDLERFSNDLVSLIDGKTVHLRHYDHETGKMSKPVRIKSSDFIIASGLHALYLPIIRQCCNLKIYLGIDEGLRRHFKLQRDVHQRGHSLERVLASLDKRETDSRRFIRPQAAHSDLIFSLQPIHPRMIDESRGENPPRLKLLVTTRQGFNELALNRVLVGVCGLHVDILVSDDSREVGMMIEGEASSADLALAARILCPRTLEFLDMTPTWTGGMTGLMQLITLSHISQALTKRFIQ